MKYLFLAGFALLVLFPRPLFAQSGTEAQAEMEDMVVTATRTEEPLKTIPGRVEVITREEIKDLPVQTVDEALSYVSGVQVNRQSLYSHSTTVSMRGLGQEQGRTLVLMDGMPMNSSDTGSVNWNRINLEDIQRIEILKGPAASIYGNNAMGGVINIITQKPTKYFQGMLASQYGSYNDWQLRGSAGFRTSEDKKGLWGRISARYHNASGYKTTPVDERDHFTAKNFINEKTLNGKMGYDFTETNNVELQYTMDNQLVGEGEEIFAYNGVHRGYNTGVIQGRINLAYEGWSGTANVYFSNTNYARTQEKGDATSDYLELLDEYSRVDSQVNRKEFGILTNISRQWGPNTFTAGFDFRDGLMDGTDYSRVPDFTFATDYGKIRNLGAFFQDQIKLFDDKLIILAGLRYDSATTYDGRYDTDIESLSDYNASYPSHTWDQWSPRVSAKYFFLDNLSAYLSYGHAFRAPVLDDMYRSGKMRGGSKIANPSLGPETTDSFELGVDYQPFENLKLSGTGYCTLGKDFQYYVNVDEGIYQKQNVGKVHIWGAEFDVDYEPFKFTDIELFRRFTLFGNYTFNDSRIVDFPEEPELNGKLLTYTPQNSFNVGFTWFNKYINNKFTLQYNGKMYTDDANTDGESIDQNAILSGKIWRNFDFISEYGRNVEMSLAVDNILGFRYINSRNSNSMNMGRTFYLELTCKF